MNDPVWKADKPRKKTIKAWAVLRNGNVCKTFGRERWIYSTKTRAQAMTPNGYETFPCTITYTLPAKTKRK